MHIETDRLIITDFDPSMAPAVRRNSLDPDMHRFLPDEVFETEREAEDALAHLIASYDSPFGPFVHPVLMKDGTNIGYVELAKTDGAWEIGYHIALAFSGNGYAAEAVAAFLPVVSDEKHIPEILGICDAENTASVRVLEKCGFRPLYRGRGLYQARACEIAKYVWRAGDF